MGDYVDYGFFSINEQSIVLKFDDGDAAKGTYSIKGDSLLTIEIEFNDKNMKWKCSDEKD